MATKQHPPSPPPPPLHPPSCLDIKRVLSRAAPPSGPASPLPPPEGTEPWIFTLRASEPPRFVVLRPLAKSPSEGPGSLLSSPRSLSPSLQSLSLSLVRSASPLFFLSLVCVPAAHSGSHLVFLISFYMSPRTLARSLPPSLSLSLCHLLSCSTPPPPPPSSTP